MYIGYTENYCACETLREKESRVAQSSRKCGNRASSRRAIRSLSTREPCPSLFFSFPCSLTGKAYIHNSPCIYNTIGDKRSARLQRRLTACGQSVDSFNRIHIHESSSRRYKHGGTRYKGLRYKYYDCIRLRVANANVNKLMARKRHSVPTN